MISAFIFPILNFKTWFSIINFYLIIKSTQDVTVGLLGFEITFECICKHRPQKLQYSNRTKSSKP